MWEVMRSGRTFRVLVLRLSFLIATIVVAGGSIAASQPSAVEVGFTGGPPGALNLPGVLHLQATHVWYGPTGQEQRRAQSEFWLDPTNASARWDQRDASGKPNVSLVRNGLTVAHFLVPDKAVVLQVASDSSPKYLNAVHDQVLGFKTLKDAGQMQVLGEEPFAGVTTTKVRTTAALTTADSLEVNLEKQSGLPVRQIAFKTDSSGVSHTTETELIKYGVVEHIAHALLASNTFATAVPVGWNLSIYRALTPNTASAFRAFSVYWLGTSFGTLPLFSMSNDEAQRTTTHINTVAVTYAQPFGQGVRPPGELTLIERPPLGPADIPTPGVPVVADTPPQRVTVAGQSAMLFNDKVVRLEITIGGTFITIHGTDAAQVLQAASSLKKLN